MPQLGAPPYVSLIRGSEARNPASLQWKDWPCGIAVWLGFVGVVGGARRGVQKRAAVTRAGGLLLQHDRMRLCLPQGALAASSRAAHFG